MRKLSLAKIYILLFMWSISVLAGAILARWIPFFDTQISEPIESSLNDIDLGETLFEGRIDHDNICQMVRDIDNYKAAHSIPSNVSLDSLQKCDGTTHSADVFDSIVSSDAFNVLIMLNRTLASSPSLVYSWNDQYIKILDMKMHFIITQYSSHANIFQTAPFNDGIRIELNRNKGNISAALLMRDREADGLMALQISDILQLNREYTIQIKIDLWGTLTVFLDGLAIGSLPNARPIVSSFLIGNGFDGNRPFLGRINIEHLKMACSNIETRKQGRTLGGSIWVSQAIGVSILLIIFACTFRLFYFVWYESDPP